MNSAPNGYRAFTRDDDIVLTREWFALTATIDIANMLKREPSTITARSKLLGLPRRNGKGVKKPLPPKTHIGAEEPKDGDEKDGRPKAPDIAAIMGQALFTDVKVNPQRTAIVNKKTYSDDNTTGGVSW